MKVIVVKVLTDNYSYLLIDESTKKAAAIDPVEPEKLINAAKSENVEIESILTTHHHWDHAGGNEKMKSLLPNIKVYGGDDRIGAISKILENNEIVRVGDLQVQTLTAPAHTTGHVLYYVKPQLQDDKQCLFTGDTLFIAGCGRLFEGNPEMMYNALYNVIGRLPNETLVYCGHEYTLKNLLFAETVDPDNQDIKKEIEKTNAKLESNQPTVPSTIGKEKLINPFMRVDTQPLIDQYKKANTGTTTVNPIDILGFIRKLKDNF
ncbi:hypothetical protein CYY_010223 [Polysphondylium violaceum]|uniref:hydroxyacylglutathione hydrolase n=1 Tax=Polysphondylium violaceum TaxID=133409 RepID=A0A8J4PK54_9MYCE|nr:hypothetical protein CYY_010223 [Polysphondylium violaceum]